jgi:tryptophan-rich sensory protein
MKIKSIYKLLIAFGATALAGAIGSLATAQSIPTWYENLNKTVLTPPNWIFGPVWTLLYILMAVAAYLVWHENKKEKKTKEALILFGGQLALNALWSIIFFNLHLMLSAFIELLLLLAIIIITTTWFYDIKKLAAYLMIPYIVWVSFASILNLLTWLANR